MSSTTLTVQHPRSRAARPSRTSAVRTATAGTRAATRPENDGRPAAEPVNRLTEEHIRTLYRLHAPWLRLSMLKVTGQDAARAEDIVQEVMVRAWRHPEILESGLENARAWLYTVGRRIAIDQLRMITVRPQEVHGEPEEDVPVVEDVYDRVLLRREIDIALAKLTPQHREALEQVHLRGRSVTETARLLGVPEGTVKSRTYYAIRLLKDLLAQQGLGPGVPAV